jgi:hypothetical protein
VSSSTSRPETGSGASPSRRQLGVEIAIVLGLSYGVAGLTSALDLLKSVAAPKAPISKQVAYAF